MKKIIFILLLLTSSIYALTIEGFESPVPLKYTNSISSGQGLREMILSEEKNGIELGGIWHNGIDYAVPYGTPIYAAKDGIVRTVYPGKGNNTDKIVWKGHAVYGSCIVLEHEDSTYTLYAHLSKTLVVTGQEVKCGEIIGASGGTGQASGRSTGNHLHFSIYVKLSEVLSFVKRKE